MKSFTTKLGAAPKGNLVGIAFGVVLLVWVLVSTAEVWVANSSETPYTYCQANIWILVTREIRTCEVVNCIPCEDYYEVYVTDNKGNKWSYYDDQYMTLSTKLTVTFDGSEIVNAKIKREGK